MPQSQTGSPAKKKLYEEIVDLMLKRIKDGELNPGDKLPSERVLAEELGVGRPVIREAIRSLELMGCIESRIGDGTYIKAPSIEHVVNPISVVVSQNKHMYNELIEVRLILETEIASLAARRRTEEQLHRLADTITEMEKEINAGDTGIEQDERFHSALAEAAGNESLCAIINMCAGMLSQTTHITQKMAGIPRITLEQHKKIYSAIEVQDEKRARSYMRKHLLRAQKNLNKLK